MTDYVLKTTYDSDIIIMSKVESPAGKRQTTDQQNNY